MGWDWYHLHKFSIWRQTGDRLAQMNRMQETVWSESSGETLKTPKHSKTYHLNIFSPPVSCHRYKKIYLLHYYNSSVSLCHIASGAMWCFNCKTRVHKLYTSPPQCEFEVMPFSDPLYFDNFSIQLVNHIVGGKISYDTPSNSPWLMLQHGLRMLLQNDMNPCITYFLYCDELLNFAMSKLGACGIWTMKPFGRTTNSNPWASSSIIWDTLFQPKPTNRVSYSGISFRTTMYGSKSGSHWT